MIFPRVASSLQRTNVKQFFYIVGIFHAILWEFGTVNALPPLQIRPGKWRHDSSAALAAAKGSHMPFDRDKVRARESLDTLL